MRGAAPVEFVATKTLHSACSFAVFVVRGTAEAVAEVDIAVERVVGAMERKVSAREGVQRIEALACSAADSTDLEVVVEWVDESVVALVVVEGIAGVASTVAVAGRVVERNRRKHWRCLRCLGCSFGRTWRY